MGLKNENLAPQVPEAAEAPEEIQENQTLEIVDDQYDSDEEDYEEQFIQELKTHPIDQIIYGISLFRESRGEILAGSTTYFIIIASMPMLLSLGYLYSYILGDPEMALKHVISLVDIGVPNLDKAIFQNISNITKTQLFKEDINYLNIFFLILSGLGFAQSTYFGLMYISDYRKDDPLQEGIYSLCIGMAVAAYFSVASFLMADINLINEFIPSNSSLSPLVEIITQNSVLCLAVFSVCSLTIFYKFMTPLKIRIIDGLLGACAFISLFAIGKTLHWVYLHYFQQELIENFGNLHSMIATTIWIYYLVASFFLGACIAFSYGRMRNQILGIDIHEEFDIVKDEEDFQDEALELLEEQLDNQS